MKLFYSNPFADVSAPAFHRFHTVQMPLFDPEDTGGAGGGTGDEGGGTGDEGGGGEFHTFSDENQRFQFPGMAKPMTVKEYQASVLPRAQYEGTVKAMSDLAKAINEGRVKPQQQQRPPQQQQQQQQQGGGAKPDVLAALESNELPTGKDLVAALRNIDETRMTPMTKLLVAVAERLKALEGRTGTVLQERDERDFSGELNRSIGSLKLPQTAGSEVLSEMARDLYLSYEDADRAKLNGETFQKLFGARFEQTRKFFRELEKTTLAQKQTEGRKRLFTRPGASSTANGKRVKMPSNVERAAALFATQSPT